MVHKKKPCNLIPLGISDYRTVDCLQRQNATSGNHSELTGVRWHTFKNLE